MNSSHVLQKATTAELFVTKSFFFFFSSLNAIIYNGSVSDSSAVVASATRPC